MLILLFRRNPPTCLVRRFCFPPYHPSFCSTEISSSAKVLFQLYKTNGSSSFLSTLFQLQFCLIPERHILSSLKVSHMHEFVVFSLPSNLVFLSPGGQMISSKISLDNQSKFELFVRGFPLSSSQFRLWYHSGMVWLKANKAIVCSEHSVSFPTSTCHLIYSPSQTPSVQLFALNANPILELESIPVACLFPTSFWKN